MKLLGVKSDSTLGTEILSQEMNKTSEVFFLPRGLFSIYYATQRG